MRQDGRSEIKLTEAELNKVTRNVSYALICKQKELGLLGLLNKNKYLMLDAGCGSGIFGELFVKDGNYVVGLDISSLAIKTARNYNMHHSNTWFIIGSLEQIPIKSNILDLCFFGNILHHFPRMNRIVIKK